MMKNLFEKQFLGFEAKKLALGAIGIYGGIHLLSYASWRLKNHRLNQRSKQILDERNAQIYQFMEVQNEEFILSL